MSPPTNAFRQSRVARAALGLALVVLASALPGGLSHGASFAPKEFEQLVDEADEIFVGTVSQLQARRLPSGAVVTDVTFSNREVVKGGGGDFVLVVMGGTLEGVTMRLTGFPEFQPGESYLVFARDNGQVILPLVGGTQGLFRVRSDPATGERLVFDAGGAPVRHASVLRALGGAARPARAFGSVAPIALDAFVQAVRARLGAAKP